MNYYIPKTDNIEIILDTHKNEILMWNNIIPIIQPYKFKSRVEEGYDILWIEFKTIHHLEYAKEIQKKINECIEQKLCMNAGPEPDLKTELYYNTKNNNPGIKFSANAKKYEFNMNPKVVEFT